MVIRQLLWPGWRAASGSDYRSSFLFAIIHVGGFMVQTLGIPSAVATMLQGAILFFVVGADIFTNYQLRLIKNEGGEESE